MSPLFHPRDVIGAEIKLLQALIVDCRQQIHPGKRPKPRQHLEFDFWSLMVKS
jgi:hypothetical protein